MDLDQLIRDADPARHLQVELPDPRSISSRRRRPSGVLPILAAAAVVVAVAAVVLGVRGSRSPQRPATPSDLPFGAPWSQAGPTGVIASSARLVATYPDPAGGPGWGLRTYRTHSGMTCLQVGRVESGQVGAFGGGRFHPFTFSDVGLGTCVPQDARGHAFVNLAAPRTPADASQEPCPAQHLPHLPRPARRLYAYCAHAALRNLYFGLLGPDATAITYVGGHGHLGRDGAYLIVRPPTSGGCPKLGRRTAVVGGCGGSGIEMGPTLTPGEITAVTYADGHTCRLPAPEGAWIPLGRPAPGRRVTLYQCPPVGYLAPAGPHYTHEEVASPVSVREVPARHYCARRGIERPDDLWIPCDKRIPAGYARLRGDQGLLVYIGWTARAPVRNVNDSDYTISLQWGGPRGPGESGGTDAVIRAGQRITRSFFVPARPGTVTGSVRYIPSLGPGGQSDMGPGSGAGLLVGRFSFRVR